MQIIHAIDYYTSKLIQVWILVFLLQKEIKQLCEVMEMLANTSVVIILQDINVEINTWCAFKHSVICQLYLDILKKQKLFKVKLNK